MACHAREPIYAFKQKKIRWEKNKKKLTSQTNFDKYSFST